MNVQPFHIEVPQATLDDLRLRLMQTRWTNTVDDAGWDYGMNRSYLQELIAYWRDHYDWHSQETMLNGFAQFHADVDGFGVHFLHVRGTGPNPTPLLLLHGWPDSFFRMIKLIPLLTDPARYGGKRRRRV